MLLKNVKLQFLAVLGLGALLAYAAAYGKLNLFQKAEAEPAEQPKATKDKQGANHDEAVRAAVKDFVKTFEKGDAKALTDLWTEEGEYTADDGTTLHGRAEIADGYTQFFKKNPDAKLDITIDSVHFVSHQNAVVEGTARSHAGAKSSEPTSSRVSILLAKEDGKWLVALLREWTDSGAALRDVEWLIGSWEAKNAAVDVHTTYEWNENKTFIHARFTIKDKDTSLSGTQLIGIDPRTGLLHSWLFESDGGFGEAVWTWDGKQWRLEATGVEADGGETTATNLMTPVNKDSFSWQSIDRTVNGEDAPNIPPVKVVRVK